MYQKIKINKLAPVSIPLRVTSTRLECFLWNLIPVWGGDWGCERDSGWLRDPQLLVAGVGFELRAVWPWMEVAASPGCTGPLWFLTNLCESWERDLCLGHSPGPNQRQGIRGAPKTLSHPFPVNKHSEPSRQLCKVSPIIPIVQLGTLSLREGPGFGQSPTSYKPA